jgi:hypothetical protein
MMRLYFGESRKGSSMTHSISPILSDWNVESIIVLGMVDSMRGIHMELGTMIDFSIFDFDFLDGLLYL